MSTSPRLFISFSCMDDDTWRSVFKETLRKQLKWPDGDIFFSETAPIQHGDVERKIAQALDGCECLIMIVGDHYLESDWCKYELAEYFKGERRAARRERLIVPCLSERTFDELERWPPWIDAGLAGLAKLKFFHSDGKTIRAALDHEGRLRVNETFGSKVAEMAKLVKAIVGTPAEPDPPADRPAEEPQETTDVVIGACSKRTLAAADELEAMLKADAATSGLRLRRLSMDDIANDDFDVSDSSTARLLEASRWFVVPYADEKPLLPVLGPGGHLGYEARCWQHAQGRGAAVQMILWKLPLTNGSTSYTEDVQADEKHVEFLEGLTPDADAAVDVFNRIKGLSAPVHDQRTVKIVIEGNDAEYIGPEPLQRRIESLWKDLPSTRDVELRTIPVSIAHMRDLKTELDADAVILLWGNKGKRTIYSQVENVDRYCQPNRSFIAYLAPPNVDEFEGSHLVWKVLPFRVVSGRHDGSRAEKLKAVVKEYDNVHDQFKEFLNDLAHAAAGRSLPQHGG